MAGDEIPRGASGSGALRRKIDPETKKTMAEGRERSRVIDLYIKALETHKYRKRFRNKFDTEAMESKISQLDSEISRTVGVAKLLLIKTRGDLANQVGTQGRAEEFEHLEAAFISIAKQFSIDRGISYDNWREIGVPVRTLAKAGVYPPNARRRPLPRPKNQR